MRSFQERADADKKHLPELEKSAADSTKGELSVKLGELRYGFGDYTDAAAAIYAGIGKGRVTHLDEAYVYLGLSEAALKDEAAAKDAFNKLNTVPGISPRILSLWRLYVETHL